ncbi:hypothetical protein B0H14DRAFT_3776996 [Mycena olivaceomarginata]|nr:hypothetical protein B0H14DRAFT_3776996 [Mycena olivaceomarginata]
MAPTTAHALAAANRTRLSALTARPPATIHSRARLRQDDDTRLHEGAAPHRRGAKQTPRHWTRVRPRPHRHTLYALRKCWTAAQRRLIRACKTRLTTRLAPPTPIAAPDTVQTAPRTRRRGGAATSPRRITHPSLPRMRPRSTPTTISKDRSHISVHRYPARSTRSDYSPHPRPAPPPTRPISRTDPDSAPRRPAETPIAPTPRIQHRHRINPHPARLDGTSRRKQTHISDTSPLQPHRPRSAALPPLPCLHPARLSPLSRTTHVRGERQQ